MKQRLINCFFSVFVVQKPKNIFVLGIWLAFQPQVWPIILLLIVIMSSLFELITNDEFPPFHCCLKKGAKKNKLSLSIMIDEAIKESKRKTLIVRMFAGCFLTLQPMFGQPLNSSQTMYQPRRFKMLLVLWWFSCLIITTLYSTSLISSLINPVITTEPKSVRELINSGYHFKLGGRHAAVKELINTSSTTVDNLFESGSKFRPPAPNPDTDKMTKLLEMIRERLLLPTHQPVNPNLVAYIVEESGIGNENDLQLTNMKVMEERLLITGYAFSLKKNVHYKRKLDVGLGRLNAGGLISHWASKYVNNMNKVLGRKFRLRERLGQITLNLKILQVTTTLLAQYLLFVKL